MNFKFNEVTNKALKTFIQFVIITLSWSFITRGFFALLTAKKSFRLQTTILELILIALFMLFVLPRFEVIRYFYDSQCEEKTCLEILNELKEV